MVTIPNYISNNSGSYAWLDGVEDATFQPRLANGAVNGAATTVKILQEKFSPSTHESSNPYVSDTATQNLMLWKAGSGAANPTVGDALTFAGETWVITSSPGVDWSGVWALTVAKER